MFPKRIAETVRKSSKTIPVGIPLGFSALLLKESEKNMVITSKTVGKNLKVMGVQF